MKILFLLFFSYCAIILLFTVCGLFGLRWDVPIKEETKPAKKGKEPHQNLPVKVSSMEWVVVGNNTEPIEVIDINNNRINLN